MIQTIFALASLPLILAAPGPEAVNNVARSGSVCSKAPYSLILPFANYAPAVSFCSAKYPVAKVTTTITATPSTTITTTVTAVALSKRDNKSNGWKKCTSSLQRNGALSTACSCIETPVTTTITHTASTTTITQTSTVTPTPTNACNRDYDACNDPTYRCFTGRCGQRFSDPNSVTTPQIRPDLTGYGECWDYCDSTPCAGANYEWKTGVCTHYNIASGTCSDDGCTLTDDTDYDGYLVTPDSA